MRDENLDAPCLRQGEAVFLHYLHAHGAKYVVIGSHAILLYVGDRDEGVNDLDVVIECSEENAAKVYDAVQDYYPGLLTREAIDRLAQPKQMMTVPQGDPIDIFTSTDSSQLSFDDLWKDRCEVLVSVVVGNPPMKYEFYVPFVSKAHLLQLKREAVSNPGRGEKREQDQKDVEALR
jgi:hypothetical protein